MVGYGIYALVKDVVFDQLVALVHNIEANLEDEDLLQ